MSIEFSSLNKLRELTEHLSKTKSDVETFFSLAIDLFLIADEQKILLVNDAWESWLGWSKEETCNTPWRNFIKPDESDKVDRLVDTDMRAGNIIDFVNHMRKKNGTYLKICWRSTMWKKGLTYSVGRPVLRSCKDMCQLEVRD